MRAASPVRLNRQARRPPRAPLSSSAAISLAPLRIKEASMASGVALSPSSRSTTSKASKTSSRTDQTPFEKLLRPRRSRSLTESDKAVQAIRRHILTEGLTVKEGSIAVVPGRHIAWKLLLQVPHNLKSSLYTCAPSLPVLSRLPAELEHRPRRQRTVAVLSEDPQRQLSYVDVGRDVQEAGGRRPTGPPARSVGLASCGSLRQ